MLQILILMHIRLGGIGGHARNFVSATRNLDKADEWRFEALARIECESQIRNVTRVNAGFFIGYMSRIGLFM